MNERNRSRRDFLQNIVIAVLTVSAVLLFTQSQVSSLGASSLLLRFFSDPVTVSAVSGQQETALTGTPVRVAAASDYGRYGSLSMTTEDESYQLPGQLLDQALASVEALTASTPEALRTALTRTSIYYDFLFPLPLSLRAELTPAALEQFGQLSVRQLVLSEESDGIALYLLDSEGRCYRSHTALTSGELTAVVSQYELDSCFFAFEGTGSQTPAPLSLLPSETMALPQLAAEPPSADSAQLLSAFRFNPNTQNRYHESDGTEVVTETDGRSLRLSADGTVLYQGGSSPLLSIAAAGDIPSLPEAAAGASQLLSSVSALLGDARFHLEEIRQTGAVTTLRFGVHAGGVPIRFTDGGCAAAVVLDGTSVTSLELRLRQYTLTETPSLLLPLRQALAITADGAELSIGYADSGGDTVSAVWLAD